MATGIGEGKFLIRINCTPVDIFTVFRILFVLEEVVQYTLTQLCFFYLDQKLVFSIPAFSLTILLQHLFSPTALHFTLKIFVALILKTIYIFLIPLGKV